jgi:hypothetical protein
MIELETVTKLSSKDVAIKERTWTLFSPPKPIVTFHKRRLAEGAPWLMP